MGITTYIKNTLIYPPKVSMEMADTYLISGGDTVCVGTSLFIDEISPATFKISGSFLSYGGIVNAPLPANMPNGKIWFYDNGDSGELGIGDTPPANSLIIATFSTNATLVTSFKNIAKGIMWSSAWSFEKRIFITGTIVAGTTININIAGVDYNIIGNDISLGTSADAFNNSKGMFIMKNGVSLQKGVDITYQTSSEVQLAQTLEAGDLLMILR